jgi:prepilin-type N-terminal cleavage/methylation domain-containing protein
MNSFYPSSRSRAMTLIELSVTLALLLAFASVVAFSLGGLSSWKLGRRAAVELQAVYLAQKSYLADHPTESISTVSTAELLPYLPTSMSVMPQLEAMDGSMLTINHNVIPPTLGSGGAPYDPSGEPYDGLWDVGRQ